jgi:ferric-dicitrate binding protein FerR (iron transport regulator)
VESFNPIQQSIQLCRGIALLTVSERTTAVLVLQPKVGVAEVVDGALSIHPATKRETHSMTVRAGRISSMESGVEALRAAESVQTALSPLKVGSENA